MIEPIFSQLPGARGQQGTPPPLEGGGATVPPPLTMDEVQGERGANHMGPNPGRFKDPLWSRLIYQALHLATRARGEAGGGRAGRTGSTEEEDVLSPPVTSVSRAIR